MANKLQQALYTLDRLERTAQQPTTLQKIDARAKIAVTLFYLLAMLSVPLRDLSDLLLFLLYPILTAALCEIRYGILLRRSLFVVPFAACIALFNPIFDRQIAFFIGRVAITEGWISFISIIVRGLLSVQVALLLIYSTGFHGICRNLQRMGMPSLLAVQLLFVYRYLFVLLNEVLSMSRARDARSYGRRSYTLKLWSVMIGQLLLRTYARAERIHAAMLSRGFTGRIVTTTPQPAWQLHDTLFLILWTGCFLILRLVCPAENIF